MINELVCEGTLVQFMSFSGKVLNVENRSETSISSSGGTSYLYNGEGRINAPRIHSNVTRWQDLWISRTDGRQESIRLNDSDIPLMKGQRITVVCARKGKEGGWYSTLLINHEAAKWWTVWSASDMVKEFGIAPLAAQNAPYQGPPYIPILSVIMVGAGIKLIIDSPRGAGPNPSNEGMAGLLLFASGIVLFVLSLIARLIRYNKRKNEHRHQAEIKVQTRANVVAALEQRLGQLGANTKFSS